MERQSGTGGRGGGARLVPGLGLRAGQTIRGKYRIEELLGSGASGIVVAARTIPMREAVVLKILASTTDGQAQVLEGRLEKARVAARLRGDHVARIVDIGTTEDGMPFIASEHLRGTTLEVELEDRGVLPVEQAVRWVLEACEGVAEAHALGLVHGDLKPRNIFLAHPKARARARRGVLEDGVDVDARIVKVLDFGTSSPLDAIGDQSASAFFGSPAFVAPEQVQDAAHVDARADIWALGVLLYNLISGSLPFSADSVSGVIVAVVYDAPTLLTEAPYGLAKVVAQCLEKDPARRPRDVKELAAALAPFAGADGPYLAARVDAMRDAPPAPARAPRDSEARASGSVGRARVATSTAAEATRPSKRMLATRRRSRRLALVAVGATLVVAWVWTRNAARRAPEPAAVPTPTAVSTTELTGQELVVPSVAVPGPIVPTTPAALPDADEARPVRPITPTPLAATPTPLAAPRATPTGPRADVLPKTPHPAAVAPIRRSANPPPRGPKGLRTGTPAALPAGLPSSREPAAGPGLFSERK